MTSDPVRRPLILPIVRILLAAAIPVWGGGILLRGGSPWRDIAFASTATAALGALAALAGIAALRRLFALGGATGAVARVHLAEMVRRRASAIAIAALFGGLAIIPPLLEVNPVLDHRLASLISYGLFLAFSVLAVVTIFGACASLCEEIADRRIHALATTPAARSRILLGKWLALVLHDAMLLAAAGGVILASVHIELARARGAGSDTAAGERLLLARRPLAPETPPELAERVRARVDELRTADPSGLARAAEEHGGDEEAALRELGAELWRQELLTWRSVPPGERREYRFEVPPGAAEGTLRLRPELGRLHSTERIRFVVAVDGVSESVFIGGGETAAVGIPAAALADGTVGIAIENPAEQELASRTAILTGTDGLVLEVPMGGLAGNLARALAILAIHLGFIAALGLAAGTFLGLPVAVLLVGATLVAAAGGSIFIGAESPFAAPDSHGHDHGHSHGPSHGTGPSAVLEAADSFGRAVIGVLAEWGRSPAIAPASAGEEIPGAAVGRCLLWIGAVWTGLVVLGGAAILRRRELARVQV